MDIEKNHLYKVLIQVAVVKNTIKKFEQENLQSALDRLQEAEDRIKCVLGIGYMSNGQPATLPTDKETSG